MVERPDSGTKKGAILGIALQDISINYFKGHKHKIILIFLWLFHVVNNYIWLKMDTYPLLWDAALHFFDSLRIFDLLKHSGLNFVFEIAKINREYSFFVPLIASVFYNVFGVSEDIGVIISGSIFLAVLIFSVYGISKNICSKKAGLLAAFLITAYPLIFSHSRIFMYDLPLTAIVSLSVYVFQISDNFRKRSASLFLGVVFGAGMLTKFPFPLFVASALLYYSYKIYIKIMCNAARQGNMLLKLISEHSSRIINLVLTLIVAIILSSTWYLPNLSYLLKTLIEVPQVYGAEYPPVLSFQSLSFYFFGLINYQISFSLFLVFILGFNLFIKSKSENKFFLIYWILIPYFVFTFLYYKDIRYTLPYLPAIAVITSVGFFSIKSRKIKSIAVSAIVGVALTQFIAYSYGIKYMPGTLTFEIAGNTIFLFNQKGHENAMEQHRNYIREDWKTAEILDSLKDVIGKENVQQLNVFIIPDDPRIHSPLTSLAYLQRIPINFAFGSWDHIATARRDCVITKDGNWMVPPYFMDKINKSVKWFEANIDQFYLIRKISLPDKSNLLIYKMN